ncbi:hypothetical protein [Paraburkholderia antibiotica]|uniref:Uncharacterized protein n=1 Tax=Paraburkholderia antibiotica TaxID=2728839 RepID=A0A7X9X836_9BURK|nr:hypothetical protein [Paraburkholderia antibiotica]NML33063.1 hypothetical protein [Paraburkholderia antibiotica]
MNERGYLERQLSALVGLDLSGVGYAADMLTLQFGPIREAPSRRGTIRHIGLWALHVQCDWRLEQGGRVLASYADFAISEDSIRETALRMREIVSSRSTAVESVAVDDRAGVMLFLSHGFRLVVAPNGAEDDEDWRFFAPGVHGLHLVIEGGRIVPESFD